MCRTIAFTGTVLVLCFVARGCASSRSESIPPSGNPECPHGELRADGVCRLSLTDLTSHPELHDGRRVRVSGRVSIGFEGNSVSPPTRGRPGVGGSRAAVWLRLTPEQEDQWACASDSWAEVEGEFDAQRHGHLGAYAGELKSISAIDNREPDTPAWGLRKKLRCHRCLRPGICCLTCCCWPEFVFEW